MAEEGTAVDTSASQQSESQISGEAQASTATGESVEGAPETNGESSPESLFDGMTGEQLHKSYKSLQGEYSKQREGMKMLEQYGTPEQIAQWAAYLQNNPRFQDWVKQEQSRNAYGINEGELDEDQQKAMNVVQNIVNQTVEARLSELKKQEIDPIAGKLKDETLEKHFESMDKKYGAKWREHQDKMGDLSEDLPPKIQDNPSFKNVEALYFQALAEVGKLDTYAAEKYQEQLNEKKKKATEKPTDHVASQPKAARTMQEAFEQAKRSAGVT